MKTPASRNRFSLRRKVAAGLLLLVVAYIAYGYFVGMAFTAGIPTSDMDWDGDGIVTGNEVAQAWHAVVVEKTLEGQRECKAFSWRRSGESIRVDCRTTMKP